MVRLKSKRMPKERKFIAIGFISTIIATIIYNMIPVYDLSSDLPIVSESIFLFSDAGVRDLISSSMNFLPIVVSLITAIYVFTHREQKSVSPSASTEKKKVVLIKSIIILLVITYVLGFMLLNDYNNEFVNLSTNENSTFSVQKLLIFKTYFWIFIVGSLLGTLFTVIIYLFNTMSMDNMLKYSIQQTQDQFYKVLSHEEDFSKKIKKLTKLEEKFENSKPILKKMRKRRMENFWLKLIKLKNDNKEKKEEKYVALHFGMESVFQNLAFAAEHSMNKEFENSIKDFSEVLKEIVYDTGNNSIAYFLLLRDEDQFVDLYGSILKSNLALVNSLLKNKQYNKAKMATELFMGFYTENEHLQKKFKIRLIDFIDLLDVSDERQLLIFKEELYKLPKKDSFIIYKFLLFKLVNKNELKNLINIVYDYSQYKDEDYVGTMIVRVLLQTLIKSIEITQYQTTGFFIKFLITNFEGKSLNSAMRILRKNPKAFISVLEFDSDIEAFEESGEFSVGINLETFDYCFEKAFILLYAQHNFSIQKNLWYTKKYYETGDELDIAKVLRGCNHKEYLFTKIVAASKSYGLLMFNDETTLAKVKAALGIEEDAPAKNIVTDRRFKRNPAINRRPKRNFRK